MDRYNHKKIESKWQKEWEKADIYKTPDEKKGAKNFYLLVEYPYPSGNLHIGHWYAFAVPDIFARKKRMEGYNVLFPIGFDSFGLPAENAAIKNNLDPRKWTYKNIEHMTTQLERMGNSFDWSRKVVASDPEYYRWTQWLFLKLFNAGLVYKKKGEVRWCPSCQTVLANEQIINDKCERCGTEVGRKEMEQWFMKITDYAERLLSDLDALPWPEEIKNSQRNWIGKSDGSEIEFEIKDKREKIKVFTTRADTLYGVTYLVLSPEHPLIHKIEDQIKNVPEVKKYIEEAKKKTEIERTAEGREKTGVKLEGVEALHPGTGERLPVFVADYVLGHYGTGAVMAVPAHDARDFAFAKKYNMPIKKVISPGDESPQCYVGEGMLVNSGEFDGLTSEKAREKITKKFGMAKTTYKLHDWSVGRQRYWGCPIPIVYNEKGEPQAIPEEHLPWLLPDDVDFKPTGTAPLARSKELQERTEKIFGKGFRPEVETLDTFIDSSWYFLRYLDPQNNEEFSGIKKQKKWMPVNRYSGGAEHTTMHLLYSRFFYKALYDLGLVSAGEPYIERFNRGLVLGPDGQKMSKSLGNVVNPDENVERVGADTVKMYLAFLGPYYETGQYPFDLSGISGVRRFLERVWYLKEKIIDSTPDESLTKKLHKTIKKVGEDIENFKFNTAISAMMIFVNEAEKSEKISREDFEKFLKILAPFAPHITEELWHELGNDSFIHSQKWPEFDKNLVVDESVKIGVQVDGRVRGVIEISKNASEAEVKKMALELPKVREYIDGREIAKFIYVPGRVVSIVTKE